jgi:four helix bundle protein
MSETEFGYKKLKIWQQSDELAFLVYLLTRNFPKEEVYGVTSQIRRAALSIPTNVAEGYGRQNRNELRQFINIALGSLSELRYLLSFALRLKYLDKEKI